MSSFVLAFYTVAPNNFHNGIFSGNTFINNSEDVTRTYNLSVATNFSTVGGNITEVNITLPSGFTYTANSNFSGGAAQFNATTGATFTNLSNRLSWLWASGMGSVTNITPAYLRFNATGVTPGLHNFTITLLGSNGTATTVQYLAVFLNDTTVPSSMNHTSVATNGNYSSTMNISSLISDNGIVGAVVFNITNTSNNQVALVTASNVSSVIWNSSYDTTALANGQYNVSIHATDNEGNINNTASNVNATFHDPLARRNILIDNTDPSVTLSKSSSTKTTIVVSLTCADTGGSALQAGGSEGTSGCTLSNPPGTYDSASSTVSGLTCGESYNILAVARDNAGNEKTSEVAMTTSSCGGGSSGGSGGSTGSASTWTNTYSEDNADLSTKGTVTKDLAAKSRIKLKIASQTHYVGVKSLTGTTAVIEISSTPQEATFNVGETKKFDADGDGFYDMKVTLNSIEANKADVSVEYLHEAVPADGSAGSGSDTGADAGDSGSSTGSGFGGATMWIVVLVVVVIVIVLFFVLRKKK